jgi:heterodisulfide reductase subunit A-like polyferredoxin
VRNLKRFVADYEWDKMKKSESVERAPTEMLRPEPQDYSEKVAVVGGGPAGLTCANDLVQKGYSVTVFDANEQLGGMMRTGIPAYRLPRDFLDHEIDLIVKDRIQVESGKTMGKDFEIKDLEAQGFKSVFIATGAQLAKKIPLEGSDKAGVLYGIPFLKETNSGGKPEIGKKVVVIGGGNVAMDVARSALRLRDDVHVALYCLESDEEMPAHEWEINEAREEGVDINPSWGPAKVMGNGKVEGFELKKCTSVFDENKKFNPKFDESVRKTIEADTVILAIGQGCDLSFLGDEIETKLGIVADPITLETSKKGVFAGGDTVTGPASLVQAVAQGHRAAESIHRYLRNIDLRENRKPLDPVEERAGIPEYANRTCVPRTEMPTTSLINRKTSFTEIDSGFSEAEAVAEAKRCLNCGGCSFCLECVRVCKAHAVDHDMIAQERDLKVGAVILANGYDVFDAKRKDEYGFGRYDNVVTSLQFERILSASGPYEGHLKRPGDGKTPKKIAWIQCVGSRDVTVGNDYCSSVCCMYATKQAIIAKEHERDVEPTIFYIDMRSFGKGFESFYNRAKNDYGTRFIRSQVSSLKENPENKNLVIRYVQSDNGKGLVEEEFDIVVLSVGLAAHHAIKDAARIANVECNRFGFMQGQPFKNLLSSREGIFLTGAANGPKDIPETVMQSSAAAALCGELLQSVRGTEIQVREYPAEKDVAGEEPRIGVFVCHCGINIASVVNVSEVAEYIKSIPGVVHTEHTIYTCSQDTQKRIKETIQEKNLNRVIVASCTPRTHEPLFQETIREAGLNKFLFEMADIREQCSWVHQKEPELATEKAKNLVRGSVGKSKMLEPIQFQKVGITKSALVIGGGMSGMTSALSLARQGFQVHLVERDKQLGGNLFHIKHSLEGYDWQKYLQDTVDEVNLQENIKVYLNSNVDKVSGFVGNFTTELAGETNDEIKHGIIIIATGAEESRPTDFLYGKNDKVVTQRELESKLETGYSPDKVVMIQCVGSRNEERPYCSRVCCGEAVKNALAIKEKNPAADISILYREIRTYEYKEEYYRKARDLGIKFIHFPDDKYPDVSETNGKLAVKVFDTVLDRELSLNPDLLVLSAATVPDKENNHRLSQMLKASLNEDDFFMEAHIKLRPVDLANEGIFVCGLAHSPKYTEENISQALAAAGRAACILSKDSLEVGGLVSVVDPDKCATCLTCVRECVYDAPFVNEDGKAEIEAVKCQGCGNCASACPAKAIQLRTFTDVQEKALFHSILKEPEVVCEK